MFVWSNWRPVQLSRYSDSLRSGRSRDRIPVGGEIFRTRTDQLLGPPSLLYNGYQVFPGVKRPGRGVDHPPPSSAEVKERVELYICFPSGPSWPILGWTLPLVQLFLSWNSIILGMTGSSWEFLPTGNNFSLQNYHKNCGLHNSTAGFVPGSFVVWWERINLKQKKTNLKERGE